MKITVLPFAWLAATAVAQCGVPNGASCTQVGQIACEFNGGHMMSSLTCDLSNGRCIVAKIRSGLRAQSAPVLGRNVFVRRGLALLREESFRSLKTLGSLSQ
ncbi:hypothetical protein K456DRAFT_36872 [Colletotrichum gloeosporioides 23]|nr:hypothetical protein K456DRAFT_36872 [Colletotrichum gloeosporioides 23]